MKLIISEVSNFLKKKYFSDLMDLQECLQRMKKIQENLLKFLDDKDNIEENFQNLTKLLEEQKIKEIQHELELFRIMKLFIFF